MTEDDLELGRPPLSPRARRARLLAVGAVALVAAVVGGVLLLTRDDPPRSAPAPLAAIATPPATTTSAGPVLVEVDGRTQLAVPADGGSAATLIALEPAPDAVAAVRRAIPNLTDVRGGRVTDPSNHYRLYLVGRYDAVDGSPVTLTLYSARAPQTPPDVEVGVVPIVVSDERSVRTDVSVHTGTGWWVHAVARADTPDPVSGDQAAVVRAVALAPVLVS